MDLQRSRSFRSRDSSSHSDQKDPRERVKDFCRQVVAFMCTQVGVGGLIVGYTLVGAFAFMHIETTVEAEETHNVTSVYMKLVRGKSAVDIWDVAMRRDCIFNETAFKEESGKTLSVFQDELVKAVKKRGYGGRRPTEVWSYPAALMFSLSIITMIGYGNLVPRTGWGKGLTVVYAVFGIPLYVLYFLNMGEVLAACFRWIYTKLYECSTEPDPEEPPKRIIVPSTACLWVIGVYVLTGAIMFAEWENWSYLDSTYFCVTSLCKLGFGDLVPGANISGSLSGNQSKMVITFGYMLIGLGLVAMCYNLMREEVRVKATEMTEDLTQCLEDTRMRLMRCCGRCGGGRDTV